MYADRNRDISLCTQPDGWHPRPGAPSPKPGDRPNTTGCMAGESKSVPEVKVMKAPFLLGRLLFGGYFLYNGIHHFQETEMLAQYAGAKGVPKPSLAVKATGAAMLIGGASILLGIKPKLGAMALIGFLAGVSPI